jgi:hypothetical protein
MERRGRGDEKEKKGIKEREKKALTGLVWGQENYFISSTYFHACQSPTTRPSCQYLD